MAQIDFSYLDKFAGEKIKVINQLNPDYNRGKNVREEFGRMLPLGKWASIEIMEGVNGPEHDSGRLIEETIMGFKSFRWTTKKGFTNGHQIPYLGNTQTFWRIEKLEDGLILFDHVPVSENTYNLVNHEQKVLGQIELSLPYNSPYDCYACLASSEKARKHMDEFLAWRNDLVRAI